MINTFGDFPFDLQILSQIFKWLYILGLSTYLIFALVVIRQVKQMVMTVDGPLTGPLKLASYIHFLLALAVFVMAIIVL